MKDLINVVMKFKPDKVNPNLNIQKLTKEELMELLYQCEASSEHPLAQAMVKRAKADHPGCDS